jgi:glycosyltransferase involved in cell wall biosynthesis
MNATISPSISVLMATYNGAEFIAESLDSVIGQTSPPDEVIVVDDGSTDRTASILAGYADSIKVIHQPNRGVSVAFNRAIAAATSAFIALSADDDIWEPNKLALQRKILADDHQIDILVGHMRVFGRQQGEFRRPPGCGRLDRATLRRAQFERSDLAAPTAVIRRSLFERIGSFREDLPAEDYEFWLRALRGGAVFHYDPRPVVCYRTHLRNASNREWLVHETHYEVLRDYAEDVDDRALVARVLARNRLIVARHRLGAGRHDAARHAFAASFRYRPSFTAAMWALVLRNPLGTRFYLLCKRIWRRRPRRRARNDSRPNVS